MVHVVDISLQTVVIFSDEIMREQFVKSGEWKLTDSRIEKSEEIFKKYRSQIQNQKYSVITYRFLLRREPTFYLVNVIVPCFQIIFLGPRYYLISYSKVRWMDRIFSTILLV